MQIFCLPLLQKVNEEPHFPGLFENGRWVFAFVNIQFLVASPMLFTFDDSNQDKARHINKENYFCSVSS